MFYNLIDVITISILLYYSYKISNEIFKTIKANDKVHMNKIRQVEAIPIESEITTGFDPISYADTYRLAHPLDESFEQIIQDIFTPLGWSKPLFSIRDAVVRPFGLQTSKNITNKNSSNNGKLEPHIPFTILKKTENEILMEEKDKHLNFRVSVLLKKQESAVYLTTIVHFNNTLGKLYFFFIKPFHKMIMKAIFKNALKLRQSRMSGQK